MRSRLRSSWSWPTRSGMRRAPEAPSLTPSARCAAERAEDDALRCAALAVFGLIHFRLGRGIDREAMARALALEESLALPPAMWSQKLLLCDQLFWSHDLIGAQRLAEELPRCGAPCGWPPRRRSDRPGSCKRSRFELRLRGARGTRAGLLSRPHRVARGQLAAGGGAGGGGAGTRRAEWQRRIGGGGRMAADVDRGPSRAGR